ncbi:MAG: hypothetical protein DHS20C21_09420 [Gemmatimonadota bacterium]|nr:MAG: hypothetical protein DHS20C21_09420 [Gemmatimonadota bacterium]
MRKRWWHLPLIGAAVLAAEGALCAALAGPGSRLRIWVDLLTIQGIVLAILGSFLLVDRPFLAAQKLGKWGGPGRSSRAGRLRWGLTMIAVGAALFGAAHWIWSAAFRG